MRKSTKNLSQIDYKSLKSNMQTYSWFALISTSFIIYLKENYKHDGNGWCSKIIKNPQSFPFIFGHASDIVLMYCCIDCSKISDRCLIEFWLMLYRFLIYCVLKSSKKMFLNVIKHRPQQVLHFWSIWARFFARFLLKVESKIDQNQQKIDLEFMFDIWMVKKATFDANLSQMRGQNS